MKLALFILIIWAISSTILYYLQSKNVKLAEKHIKDVKEIADSCIEEAKYKMQWQLKIANIDKESLKIQVESLERHNMNLMQELHRIKDIVYQDRYGMFNNSQNIDKDTIDAVYYAMKKSHPDNGGNQEDFIKFKACYDRISRGN